MQLTEYFEIQYNSPCINPTLSSPVPSTGSQITAVYNTSSTSILVQWDPIPEDSINGVLLSYSVRLYLVGDPPNTPSRMLPASPNATYLEIPGLKKFTRYGIVVAGRTRKGRGVMRVVVVTTGEDGNYNTLIVGRRYLHAHAHFKELNHHLFSPTNWLLKLEKMWIGSTFDRHYNFPLVWRSLMCFILVKEN